MRSLRLALAAAALAAVAAPLAAAHADPLCTFWYDKPTVTVNAEDRTVSVDPGGPGYAC